eukprot:7857470-Pyramimonas_sp.AAC.1
MKALMNEAAALKTLSEKQARAAPAQGDRMQGMPYGALDTEGAIERERERERGGCNRPGRHPHRACP